MSCHIWINKEQGHWCGQMWMGRIIKCDECEHRDLVRENLRLQNQLLKKRLKDLKD